MTGRLGKCGHCGAHPWVEGAAFPPCDDETCTTPWWELTEKFEYVVGFVRDLSDRVIFLRKTHPQWQADRLNGVGGRMERDETIESAMQREFLEETGIIMDLTWHHYATIFDYNANGPYTVHMLHATGNGFWNNPQLAKLNGNLEEKMELHDWRSNTWHKDCINNLLFTIPMAFASDTARSVVEIRYNNLFEIRKT